MLTGVYLVWGTTTLAQRPAEQHVREDGDQEHPGEDRRRGLRRRKDQHHRRYLNLGHTFAHAYEHQHQFSNKNIIKNHDQPSVNT